MGLSVTEKQELRRIVEQRIGRRIEAIEAEHKDEIRTLKDEVYQNIFETLRISKEYAELTTLRDQASQLAKDILEAEKKIAVKLGVDKDYGTTANAISGYVSRRQQELFNEAKMNAGFYAEVKALREEARHLDEFVWTATSTKQVAQLFEALNTVLDEQPTKLTKAAQEIEHVE